MELKARNTNDLMYVAYQALHKHGVEQRSRNGDVLRIPGVTTIIIDKPMQRVNFCPVRDANPFFHYFEALMMLGAKNDAKAHAAIVPNMMNYSDGGDEFNAYYGTRIREHNVLFPSGNTGHIDQLDGVVQHLQKYPDSRQAVVQIWDAADLLKFTKDKACNISLIFEITQWGSSRRLNMTLFNRSNDAIWGTVSGANIFHFSMFHQHVADALGMHVGKWTTVSNNLHVYLGNPQWDKLKKVYVEGGCPGWEVENPYDVGDHNQAPLEHILSFMQQGEVGEELSYSDAVWRSVDRLYTDLKRCIDTDWGQTPVPREGDHAGVFLCAFAMYKIGKKDIALDILSKSSTIPSDLKQACLLWLLRRK